MSSYIQSALDFVGANPSLTIIIVFLVSAGEAILVIGLFVPSTVVLVAVGTMVGTGTLSFLPVFLAASFGAVVGDAVSFWFGHVWKEKVRDIWPFSRYTSMLDKGEAFFKRHGGKSVFIGRFIPGVKAVVPGIAGMMGMSVLRFTVINIVSAFAWAGAHIIPAVALGRGFDLARSANPRLAALLLVVLAILVVAWYMTKILLAFALPHIDGFRLRSAEHLKAHGSTTSNALARVLLNEDDAVIAFSLAVFGLLAAVGFILLAVNLLFEPELAASDRAISTFIQSLRNSPGDTAMVLITMLADSFALVPLALAFVGSLLWLRRWRLAGMAGLAYLGAAVFVPVTKSILHRARPLPNYEGAEAFSFPSGHATLSIVIVGTIVVFLGHNLSAKWKSTVYAATGATLALIAFSRVYLLAHWPSDVLAGLLFGGSVIMLLAFLLRRRVIDIPAGRIATALTIVYGGIYALHVDRSYSAAQTVYGRTLPIVRMSSDDWLSGRWKEIPPARILFDGDFAEPLILQTNLPLMRVKSVLHTAGWQEHSPTWLASITAHVLPTSGPISDLAPLRTYNGGRQALAIFTKTAAIGPGTRQVLAVWETQFEVGNSLQHSPLLTASVTQETIEPIFMGFHLSEVREPATPLADDTAYSIASALAGEHVSVRHVSALMYLAVWEP